MPAKQQTEITTFTAGDDEWWTPEWLIEASRRVLGTIDLDPASSAEANKRVCAESLYSREDNGLERTWCGRIFLNPPSRRGDPTARPHLWARAMDQKYKSREIDSGILIVKSVLGYKWYEKLYTTYPVCHLRERPEFVRPDGSIVGRAKKGVSVFYMGKRVDRFQRIFMQYGRIILP